MAATRGQTFEAAPAVVLGYDLVGDDGGLPVVLLHGLSQQRAFWGPVVRRMHARPVAVLDQRGHGASDTPVSADFSVAACARDVVALLDDRGWDQAVIVGHSWGGAVALASTAAAPDRVAAAVLVDGGLWGPSALGDRAEVRRRLTPPTLGLPADELWGHIRHSDLADSWSDEVQAALSPTFVADADGNLSTRLGLERHMHVLDGLLDHDGPADLAVAAARGVPIWAVVCEPSGAAPPATDLEARWQEVKAADVGAAGRRANCRVLRWAGAVHDVPLQWPALVAGLVDTAVEAGRGRRA